MKIAVFLLAIMVIAIGEIKAQIKPDVEKIKANTRIKQAPSKTPPAPAPAPVNKTTGTTTSEPLVYKLSSVRVKIRTGNDNKEFPSKVYVWIKARNQNSWSPFYQAKLDNEMKVNSETEFGLDYMTWNGETGLNAFQASGLVLRVSYLPNFFADAWKIEGVTLVLEFKDQYGNLHPTLGSKTIVFSNAYGFLNDAYRDIECVADATFAPLTANIYKKAN
jgi:hypothetical protein